MSNIIQTIILVIAISLFIILYDTNTFDIYVEKITNLFSSIKSKLDNVVYNIQNKKDELKKTQLNYQDSLNILNFLKMKYKYDSILIPKTLSYEKEHNSIIFKNIEILGINDNNSESKTSHIITLKFIPTDSDTFISEYNLFGINGNFYLNQENTVEDNMDVNESVFEIIPDIIRLSSNNDEEIEIDSIVNTTESIMNKVNSAMETSINSS